MIKHSAFKKYFYYLFHFTTARKVANIFHNNIERVLKRTTLKSYPYKITIDPTNFCNLRCPGCHTGIKHPEMIKSSFLSFANYQTMFDKLKKHTLSIALYNWGEPFLNKDIFKIIKHTTDNKVGSTMHSNFNVFSADMAENLVSSGLTHLYLSIDGASQETYAQYRVKGDFENVLSNVRLLVAAKKQSKSKLPFITWKFLVFPHNAHEVETARTMAKNIGVDNFRVYNANLQLMDIYDEASHYIDNPEKIKTLTKPCASLWSSTYIGPDGTVFPCSLSFRKTEAFGNLLSNDFFETWNSNAYKYGRDMFVSGVDATKTPLPCAKCKYALICNK